MKPTAILLFWADGLQFCARGYKSECAQTHRFSGTVLAWAAKTIGVNTPSNPLNSPDAIQHLSAAINTNANTLPAMKSLLLIAL